MLRSFGGDDALAGISGIIAAMIFLAKFADPADVLKKLEEKGTPRVFK